MKTFIRRADEGDCVRSQLEVNAAQFRVTMCS